MFFVRQTLNGAIFPERTSPPEEGLSQSHQARRSQCTHPDRPVRKTLWPLCPSRYFLSRRHEYLPVFFLLLSVGFCADVHLCGFAVVNGRMWRVQNRCNALC